MAVTFAIPVFSAQTLAKSYRCQAFRAYSMSSAMEGIIVFSTVLSCLYRGGCATARQVYRRDVIGPLVCSHCFGPLPYSPYRTASPADILQLTTAMLLEYREPNSRRSKR
jgi:hypothetical protein